MINTKSKLDTNTLTQPKNRLSNGDDCVEVFVHDSPIVCAFYLHLCLSECFPQLSTQSVIDIVHTTHHKGIGNIGEMKKSDADECLKKVDELNERTNNELKFTMKDI